MDIEDGCVDAQLHIRPQTVIDDGGNIRTLVIIRCFLLDHGGDGHDVPQAPAAVLNLCQQLVGELAVETWSWLNIPLSSLSFLCCEVEMIRARLPVSPASDSFVIR